MPIYINLLKETKSLSDLSGIRQMVGCQGCGTGCKLNISCVFFEKIASVELCTCTSIPAQLLARDLFACAPQLPTLAVDVNMLDFVCKLFVQMAPNTTAWTTTVENFLQSREFQLGSPDRLRKRFTAALQWYTSLVDNVALSMKDIIRSAPDAATEDPQMCGASQYLQDRCPLCFGNLVSSERGNMLADVIVCMDGNFTQKRTADKEGASVNDFPRHHPDSVFISAEDLKAMEKHVEARRPSKGKQREGKQNPEPDNQEDGYDGHQKECKESFRAADESQEKASTQFFADTGLMALMCRHDQVLWLVNMTSAGERQYFALALIYMLFQHLASWVIVGLLYDIACTLHQSCEKWGFLPEFKDHLLFSIAVFHAYGHQWPCQIIYHPRKCLGFGLTDVSGFFARFYILDSQIKELDEKLIKGFADWLSRKWTLLLNRESITAAELEELGISEDVLQREWASQSKKLGNLAVQQILNLKDQEREEKEELVALNVKSNDGEDVFEELRECRQRIKDIQNRINKKKALLTLESTQELEALLDNKYLQTQMNALAVKIHLRTKLRQRKFEVAALTENYQSSANSQKLKSHTEKEVKRKEGGIQSLVRTYNNLVTKMEMLVQNGEAPGQVVIPAPVDKEGLFSLDIADGIWDDVGLSDELDGVEALPLWLSDDKVRRGIKFLLEWDRCTEEREHLQKEMKTLQIWMRREWERVESFIAHMASLERKCLLELCGIWQTGLRIMGDIDDSHWGPSLEEIYQARAQRCSTQQVDEDIIMFSSSDSDLSYESDEELIFISEVLDPMESARI
ncbi:hypothetical protein C8J56DRAFT_1007514 [Mycena floridula]|nr:hypothetical protein C8J56DRAFT_1007514 [Mycena floridula]